MSIWVPPSVNHKLREETARREGRAAEGLLEQKEKWIEEFNRDLHAIQPGMKLVWCPDPAPIDAVAMGAKPGRWGILMPGLRGAPTSVKPIIGPDDSFVDPSLNASAIFESLREQDWWSPEVHRERERAKAAAKAAAAKRKEEERERMTEEILEAYLAGTRTSVSMNRDTKWAQNAAGYKRTRGRKK